MKKGTFLIIFGLLLIAAALGLCAYNILDSRRAENATREIVTELAPLINPSPVPAPDMHELPADEEEIQYPDYILDPDMDMPIKTIDGEDYVGILSMPALELELSVISDWNYASLQISPCVFTGTAYKGNFCICAHNYWSHFGQIKNLSIGDEVSFTDMAGNVFSYRVIEIETLMPYDVELMMSDDYDLTLFTCTIGGQSRVTVRCEKI